MRKALLGILGLVSVLVLSGCIVRTYPLTKDRLDQDLSSGNKGYVQGSAPTEEASERKETRTVQIVEVELGSPIRFEKGQRKTVESPKDDVGIPDTMVEGNRGYITQTMTPEIAEPQTGVEKYKVQKGETLQKISKKFYGTTRKWNKIYEANRDTLKAPDKVYPGQVLNIPTEGKIELKEPKENLK